MARSLEQIWNEHNSVGALRKECSRLGIKYVTRDGGDIPTSDGRKNELLEAISRHENTEKPTMTAPIPTIDDPVVEMAFEAIKDEVVDPPTDYSEYEFLLRELATKYYQGFTSGEAEIVGVRQFAQTQIQRAQNNESLMDVRLFATVAHFKDELTALASEKSSNGVASPSTIINLRTEIINRIKRSVTAERDLFTVKKELEGMNPIITDYLTQAFEAFRSGAIASFSRLAREKRESQGTNFLARRTSTPHAEVFGLVNWAITRLKKAPIKAQEWREIALAIMIVTGRRPAEVMSTGVFTAIDQTNLKFYGQLKKKEKKGENNDEQIYCIPAIGDTAKEVENAIGWLEMMDKRTIPASRSLDDKQLAAKKCHDRFSTYLSLISSTVMPDHLVLENEASWDLDENRSRIKPYLARQIYLQSISKLVQKAVNKGVSIDPDLAVTYYSGHYLSVDGKDSSAENYLADIVISDLDKIEDIWHWIPDLSIADINSIRVR